MGVHVVSKLTWFGTVHTGFLVKIFFTPFTLTSYSNECGHSLRRCVNIFDANCFQQRAMQSTGGV
jgi:hypothetical protein